MHVKPDIMLSDGYTVLTLITIIFALGIVFPAWANDSTLIVVSILPQLEFVERVAGENAFQTLVMIPPGASPEIYTLTPDQMKQVSKAKAYFKLGSGMPFESIWLEKIADMNPEMIIFDCAEGVEILSGGEDGHAEHHHGQDPHIWSSLRNAQKMVDNIARGFIAIDPERKTIYEANAAKYNQELAALDKDIETLFKQCARRKFIVFHPAWGYFAEDYNLTQLPIEIEGKEPGADDLRKLILISRQEDIATVFASPQFNAESAKMIANEIDGTVNYIDPLRKDYLNNMREIAGKLAEAMR
jgi:zinc transport system substrate-binding protein